MKQQTACVFTQKLLDNIKQLQLPKREAIDHIIKQCGKFHGGNSDSNKITDDDLNN